jgi:hypothetical protein
VVFHSLPILLVDVDTMLIQQILILPESCDEILLSELPSTPRRWSALETLNASFDAVRAWLLSITFHFPPLTQHTRMPSCNFGSCFRGYALSSYRIIRLHYVVTAAPTVEPTINQLNMIKRPTRAVVQISGPETQLLRKKKCSSGV